jgi:hypothetical protein
MAKKKARNYAATDSTLINLRAIKKRVETLEWEMKAVWRQLGGKPAAPPEPEYRSRPGRGRR